MEGNSAHHNELSLYLTADDDAEIIQKDEKLSNKASNSGKSKIPSKQAPGPSTLFSPKPGSNPAMLQGSQSESSIKEHHRKSSSGGISTLTSPGSAEPLSTFGFLAHSSSARSSQTGGIFDRQKEATKTKSPGSVTVSFSKMHSESQRMMQEEEEVGPDEEESIYANSDEVQSLHTMSTSGRPDGFTTPGISKRMSSSVSQTSGDSTGSPRKQSQAVVKHAARVRPIIKSDTARAIREGEELVLPGAPSRAGRDSKASETGSPKKVILNDSHRIILVNPQGFGAATETVTMATALASRQKKLNEDWVKVFEFDSVISSVGGNGFTEDADQSDVPQPGNQEQVWQECGMSLVQAVLEDGFPGLCFCYGHALTGKTYTAFGEDPEFREEGPNDGWGLTPRFGHTLIDFFTRHRDSANLRSQSSRNGFKEEMELPAAGAPIFRMSFVEVQGERLRDLLHPTTDSVNIKIREHPEEGIFTEGVPWVEVQSSKQLTQLLSLGSSARILATEDNKGSPKLAQNQGQLSHTLGHAVVRMEIISDDPSFSKRQLTVVSLASSEKEGLMRPENGRSQREAISIKKAFSTLALVIKSLAKREAAKPGLCRDSTLTYLLKGCGITSKTVQVVWIGCVTPLSVDYMDTLATLKYCMRLQHSYVYRREFFEFNSPDSISARKLEQQFEEVLKGLGPSSPCAAKNLLQLLVSDPQQRLAKLKRQNKDTRQKKNKSQDVHTQTDPLPREPDPSRKEIGKLKAKNVELQMELNALKVDCDLAQSEVRDLQDKVASIRDPILTQKDQEISDLTMKNKAFQIDRVKMQHKLISMQDSLDEANGQVKRLQASLESVTMRLQKDEQATEELIEKQVKERADESALVALKGQVEALKACLEQALQQRDVANRSLEAAEGILQSIQESANSNKVQARTIFQLESKISNLEDEVTNLRVEKEHLSRSWTDAQQEIAKHPQRTADLEAQVKAAVSERMRLMQLLQSKDEAIEIHKAQGENAIKMLGQRQQALARLFQHNSFGEPNANIHTDVLKAQLKSQSEAMDAELAQLKHMNETLGQLLAACAGGNVIQELENEKQRHAETRAKLSRLSGNLGYPIPDQDPIVSSVQASKQNGGGGMEVRYLREQLNIERDARRDEVEKLRSLLKEREDNTQREIENALEEVFEGLRAQTSGVRHSVAQLQREKRMLTAELDTTRRALEVAQNDLKEYHKESEKKHGAYSREITSLWLTINKLDVLDAAKEAAIQELQREKAQISEECKIKDMLLLNLTKEKEDLAQELQDVDASLAEAAEKEGVSLQEVLPAMDSASSQRSGRSSSGMLTGIARNARSFSKERSNTQAKGDWSLQVVEKQIEELSELIQKDKALVPRTNSSGSLSNQRNNRRSK